MTRARAWVALALKAGVTIGVLAFLAHTIEIGASLDRLKAIGWASAAAALAILFAQIIVVGLRWHLVARVVSGALPLARTTRVALISQFVSLALPSTLGGDAARLLFARRAGIPINRALSGIVLDRVVGIAAVGVLMVALLPAFLGLVGDPVARLAMIASCASIALAFAGFVLLSNPAMRALARHRFGKPIGAAIRDARALAGAPERAAIAATAMLVQAMSVAAIWALALGLGVRLDLLACLVMLPPIGLTAMLPISIGGWGVREGAMVAGLGLVGVAASDALALSIASGLVQMAAGMLAGVALIGGEGLRGG